MVALGRARRRNLLRFQSLHASVGQREVSSGRVLEVAQAIVTRLPVVVEEAEVEAKVEPGIHTDWTLA